MLSQVIQNGPLLWMAIPAVTMLLVLAFGRWPNVREAISIVAGILLAVAVLAYWQSPIPNTVWVLAEPIPQLPLALQLEPLGLLFATVAAILWPVTTLYASGYMRAHHETNQTRFYAFFALSLCATMGVATAANLFTLFVFYEVLTLATYPLVTHSGDDKALRGGRTYLGFLLSSSIAFFMLAMLATWFWTGTLDFRVGGILSGHASPFMLSILLIGFVYGIGKAALMPLHRWLPAAMVAPTPVSALLHAVAVVKAGVFTILKVMVYIFGWDTLKSLPTTEVLLYIAGFSVVMASLIAMRQDNLKARLAYSTISQLAYITLGALLANEYGLLGSGLHIVSHAFGKITLFFCAGAILVAAHKTKVSELDGLGRAMPFTFACFLLASLSIIGLPPFGGLWSKWYLALGTLPAEHYILLAALMISSLLNIAYLLPIPIRAFFKGPPVEGHEAPWPSRLAIGFTTFMCVVVFIFPDWILAPLRQLAARLTLG